MRPSTTVSLLTCLLTFLLTSVAWAAPARKWTLNQGNPVEAEFVRIHEGNVILKLKKGSKIQTVPLQSLSADDIKYLREELERTGKADQLQALQGVTTTGTGAGGPGGMMPGQTPTMGPMPTTPSPPQERTWKNAQGREFKAKFVRLEGDNVILLMADGKEVSGPLAKLSQADQDYVRQQTSATTQPGGTGYTPPGGTSYVPPGTSGSSTSGPPPDSSATSTPPTGSGYTGSMPPSGSSASSTPPGGMPYVPPDSSGNQPAQGSGATTTPPTGTGYVPPDSSGNASPPGSASSAPPSSASMPGGSGSMPGGSGGYQGSGSGSSAAQGSGSMPGGSSSMPGGSGSASSTPAGSMPASGAGGSSGYTPPTGSSPQMASSAPIAATPAAASEPSGWGTLTLVLAIVIAAAVSGAGGWFAARQVYQQPVRRR